MKSSWIAVTKKAALALSSTIICGVYAAWCWLLIFGFAAAFTGKPISWLHFGFITLATAGRIFYVQIKKPASS